jgi:uncharacterized membrane protein
VRTSRLEAFSDGVLAIIITIMVLELKPPEGNTLHDLFHTTGTSLLSYLLSFVYIGIYWNNHHHMFQMVDAISGGVLWANLHLLLWLSLFPFTTSWMDGSGFARTPVMIYGVNLLAAAIAYYLLQSVIVRTEGESSDLKRAIGRDLKGKTSPVLYLAGITCAALITQSNHLALWAALGFFVVVAVMWLVPDRRLERAIVAKTVDERNHDV